MATVAVQLFGPLEVQVDHRVLGPRDFGGANPKRVLEVLLCHFGASVSKDRLIDLVWPASLPRHPAAALENYISVVRRCLDDDRERARQLVQTLSGAYRFSLDDAQFDLRRFDDLVADAAVQPEGSRHQPLSDAIALARGEILADEPYADFVVPLRALYRERVQQAVLDCSADLLVDGRHRDAVFRAERALGGDPLCERAYRILIAGHYAAGEQTAALHAYDRCRRALTEQIGASPLPDTEELYVGVLNHEPVDELLRCATGTQSGSRTDARTTALRSQPATAYASNGEVYLAYQTIGAGPTDLVFLPGSFTHVEVGWEEPNYAGFLRRLAHDRRLLLFDKRGMGMSDPGGAGDTINTRAADIGAVMDAAESTGATLFGVSEGGPMAIAYAVTHPERVRALVLYASFARLSNTDDYQIGWTAEFLQLFKDAIDTLWKTGRGGEIANPTVSNDPRFAEWIARYFRLSASPASAKAMVDYFASIDVRDLLPSVSVPTLIIHRTDEKWIDPACSRYLAEGIPGARYVEVPGRDHWPWIGNSAAVLDAALSFIDATPHEPLPAPTRAP